MDLDTLRCSLCVSWLPHSRMLQNYSASLQTPDCVFMMTYQESLQQVRDKNHAQQQVQRFFILNAACENMLGTHLGWRYFLDGQLAKHISWVRTWLSLKAASLLVFKPRAEL